MGLIYYSGFPATLLLFDNSTLDTQIACLNLPCICEILPEKNEPNTFLVCVQA